MINDDAIPRIQRIENEPTSLNNVRVYLLNEKERARTKPVEPPAESSASKGTTPQNQSNIRLVFKVDDTTNKVTVLVVDKASQKVIRSIPFDEQAKLRQGELLELLI
jgi:uncharacterized FlaG/YvyC family protein